MGSLTKLESDNSHTTKLYFITLLGDVLLIPFHSDNIRTNKIKYVFYTNIL
jgi:hypothetical protein